jgi:hypothetical protein
MGKLFGILGIGLLLAASTAYAADEEAADAAKAEEKTEEAKTEAKDAAKDAAKPAAATGEVKYGTAGCGLGAIIFGPGTGFTQVLAATTNGSSANQTFGITSGTSGCDASAPAAKSAKVYVKTNRAALAKEIARGKGETINGLAEIASCRNTSAVGTSLQKQFKQIFPNAQASDEQVSDSIVDALKGDASLGCGGLS